MLHDLERRARRIAERIGFPASSARSALGRRVSRNDCFVSRWASLRQMLLDGLAEAGRHLIRPRERQRGAVGAGLLSRLKSNSSTLLSAAAWSSSRAFDPRTHVSLSNCAQLGDDVGQFGKYSDRPNAETRSDPRPRAAAPDTRAPSRVGRRCRNAGHWAAHRRRTWRRGLRRMPGDTAVEAALLGTRRLADRLLTNTALSTLRCSAPDRVALALTLLSLLALLTLLALLDLADLVDLVGLADPAGLADPVGLAGPVDLVGPADLAGPVDLAGLVDLAGPADLADLADLADPVDLADLVDLVGLAALS